MGCYYTRHQICKGGNILNTYVELFKQIKEPDLLTVFHEYHMRHNFST